jgi:aldose 1-epimerase
VTQLIKIVQFSPAVAIGLLFLSCNQASAPVNSSGMVGKSPDSFSVSRIIFGTIDSSRIWQYTLTAPSGMAVRILNYGGIITNIMVPDRNGQNADVVLGYDSLSGYLQKDNPYLGALIGRYANRIGQARFWLGSKQFVLGANDHGNSLHGGWKGFDKKVWTSTAYATEEGASLKLQYESPDGEEGYPGNLRITVIYTLSKDSALRIEYTAFTDQPTPVNLTNHTYFNLSGGKEKDILDQELMLNAKLYTPVSDQLIPIGKQSLVGGTAMDFTASKKMGQDLAQVKGGYDHNYVLDKTGTQMSLAAQVFDSLSGRVMEMFTTEPGVQFYTGNFLDGKLLGKAGIPLSKHFGFCLEAQHYPDSPNQPSFPNTVLKPGETYHQITIYKFSTK